MNRELAIGFLVWAVMFVLGAASGYCLAVWQAWKDEERRLKELERNEAGGRHVAQTGA